MPVKTLYSFFIILIWLVTGYSTTAQFTVKGTLLDDKKRSINFTSINLTSTADSSIAFYTLSDSTGTFQFQRIPGGTYILQSRAIGYQAFSLQLDIKADTSLICPFVQADKELTGITVKSTITPTFERKRDRFVFSIANSPLVIGNNVWDVLKQTPMVQTSERGDINVVGNPQNATIFINRRKFYLKGEDLFRFLKEMPSTNLTKIEVLTIPPPFYDADGPVIDIILKKLDINGTRGTSTVSYQRSQVNLVNGSVSLDHNNNNYNQSLVISGGSTRAFQQIDRKTLIRDASQKEVSSFFENNTRRRNINGFTDIRYSLNPLLTIGTQWIVTSSISNAAATGTESDNTGIRNDYRQYIYKDNDLLNGNIFLKYYSERKAENLEISSDYLNTTVIQNTDFLLQAPQPSIKTDVTQKIRNFAVKADYSRPVSKKVTLEAGAKWGRSDIKTPYDAFINTGTNWTKLDRLSAIFDYKENISSAYTTLESDINGKWSVKGGIKVEYTGINTSTKGGTVTNNSTGYTFIFPIGYLNYSPNQKHSFSLTSRTDNSRPEYFSLNPARILLGPRTITEGNPFIRPSNGGSLELMYSYKQAYYFGLSYSVARQLYTQGNEIIPPDTLLIRWRNWGNIKQYNFWTFTQKNVIKNKWSLSFNSNLGFYSRNFNNDQVKVIDKTDNWQLYLTLNNNFSNILAKGINLYCNFSFNTPGRFGYWEETVSSWRIDAGGGYGIPRTGLRIAVSASDLLKYADRHVFINNKTDAQITTVLNNNDRRSIRISLSKSFGNTKAKRLGRRATSNEEEKQRLN